MAQFIYQFLPDERADLATNPQAWSASNEFVAAEHFAYLQQCLADSVVVLAGRAQDGIGPAIVIIEVDTAEVAEALMMSDPLFPVGSSKRIFTLIKLLCRDLSRPEAIASSQTTSITGLSN